MKWCVPALGLILAAAPAIAQERPRMVPQRDVVVTYARETTGGPRTEETAFSAAAQVFRTVNWEGPPAARPAGAADGFMLLSLRERRVEMAVPQQRILVAYPPVAVEGAYWNPALRARRLGTDTVAGMGCTEWRLTHPTRGRPPASGDGEWIPDQTACISAEGVLLRLKDEDGAIRISAVSVSFTPQDQAQFRAPAGYRRVSFQEAARMR
ncbi:hypothetical protein [Neoroseomonas rubea]|uniref:hypothetical protein n=1 Tax=Neoroseomonas rubea TaxID=2748666 RepID=UPI0018DFEE91|nr:hypothetical protein [Roseomonas rubea]